MAIKLVLFFSAVIGFAFSEVIPIEQCDESCEVNEFRITPCEDPPECTLKQGSTVNFSFDFTPKFSSPTLMTGLLWYTDGLKEYGTDLDNADGCKYTLCPVRAGRKQTFNCTLNIGSSLPTGKYNFKWKVWKRNYHEDDRECCFLTTLRQTK